LRSRMMVGGAVVGVVSVMVWGFFRGWVGLWVVG
jgi:hypothetical protein